MIDRLRAVMRRRRVMGEEKREPAVDDETQQQMTQQRGAQRETRDRTRNVLHEFYEIERIARERRRR
jgi:hypothetical protein